MPKKKQTHTQKILTFVQSVVLTTLFCSVSSTKVSEITDFNCIYNSNIGWVRSYLFK